VKTKTLTRCLLLAPIGLLAIPGMAEPNDPNFAYRGDVFNSFLHDSFQIAGRTDDLIFYQTMNDRAKAGIGTTWDEWIAAAKATSKDANAVTARKTGDSVWRLMKHTVTKFSLDRGFEFSNLVKLNERQCFLQSVILAGALQKAGYKAGVVMVWRNPENQTSNNGHAVTVMHLDNSRDILVDCSETAPFPTHTGLFMKQGDSYRYVVPQYDKDSSITGYRPQEGGALIPTSKLSTLDIPFLRSQFDYYRGERTLNGILAKNQTKAGLAESEKWLRRSLTNNPGNPLSRAVLLDTLKDQGRFAEAEDQRKKALALYTKYGWVPGRLKEPVVTTEMTPRASASTPGQPK